MMNRRIRELLITILTALLTAALFVLIAGSGLLGTADGTVSDAFYQHRRAVDGRIVVIGMDQRAVDELGPMPWNRSIMADAIAYLNSDPDNRPAVIGIDTLYVGESSDPSADAYLAAVCENGGNVVVAGAATFGSDLVIDGDSFSLDRRAVLAWDEPYEALREAASVAHINAMADTDGIIRHAMLSVDVPDIGRVLSFSRMIYEKFCEAEGVTPNPEPETTNGFYYIPYATIGGGYYDNISIIDLVNGEIDPSCFAGKVVLIGPYAAGMQDEYRTSIDHAAPTYGVEIQANLIEAFREDFFPREASGRLQLLFLFFICAGMYIFFRDRKVWQAVIGWLAVCGLWLLACFLLYRSGIILHVLWVLLFVTILFVAGVAINYIRAQREKHRVENTFGHYVDPAVMKELLATGSDALELGGKMCDIAVLFVDIRGFTTMSEALDPPTVVEIINRYLTLTTECIMKNHGTLDKFVGDCTMAFWNAPIKQEDPVYLACCAAMDMVEGSKAVGEELMQRFGRTVSFGVGVNWGPAVVGNIGAPLRMDYTAIGDTVNTAARLEANAPGGKIYISRVVADALGDRAGTTSLGATIRLKGKAEGFEVLTLDALKR
ncbi:MAG: adenylate/guanylate cyclase domain-containing protein [Lachnospiraceae bacterium]|nr:adenylate/guanylate cyclase domain-containing protein [Lachnospiraceae bacterium]